jgi:hypothetical protein
MVSIWLEIYYKEGIPFNSAAAVWDVGCKEEEA